MRFPEGQERVRRLIEHTLVLPAYQPIVDLERIEVAGREALARPTAESGFRHAGDLFDDAERAGLSWDVERVTRRVAIEGFSGVTDAARLFINASPAVIADERITEELLAVVASAPGLTPTRVVVEVTERAEGGCSDLIVARSDELRKAGFEIAVDDVGAGTSGLNRIMAIRPNWIKLDRDLISGIDTDRAKRNLVRFLVSFGRLSDVKVIAEGIERRDELSALLDMGVVYAQGFHLARPGPVTQAIDADVTEWLGKRLGELACGRLSDPRRVPLSRFARAAEELDASTAVSAASASLLRDRRCPGYVLTSQGRIVGWCSRDAVLRAAGDHRSFLSVETLASRDALVIEPEMPVADALEAAASRVDSLGADPLILASGGKLTGVVTLGDLLSAAATAVAEVNTRTAPVTGLPTRAKADEHMTALIRLSTAAAGGGSPQFDAAMVDLRRFSEFNRRMGFELGDDLLRRVAGMIRRAMLTEEGAVSHAFVGHLGDDRFVVTGPAGQIKAKLERLAAEFIASEAGTGFGESSASSAPSLRIVLMPSIFSRVAAVGEIHRLADQSRRTEREEEAGILEIGGEGIGQGIGPGIGRGAGGRAPVESQRRTA